MDQSSEKLPRTRLSPAAQVFPQNQTLRVGPAVICLTPDSRVAAPDLPGVTRLYRRRCDETESFDYPQGSRSGPGPLALLPVARSPSRPCHHDRWWALTPPVRPLPALLGSAGGNAFCCGCSQDAALAGLPPLAVSWGDLVPSCHRLRMRDWESGSSSGSYWTTQRRLTHLPIGIIPRDQVGVKAFSAVRSWIGAV
jgi:hypothetical protein